MVKSSILAVAITLATLFLATPNGMGSELNASNVSSVRYMDPGTEELVQINENHTDKSQWQEHSPNGPFNFKVITKDEWTVYLYDADRDMSMTLNLHLKLITWGRGPDKGFPTNVIGTYPIHSFQ